MAEVEPVAMAQPVVDESTPLDGMQFELSDHLVTICLDAGAHVDEVRHLQELEGKASPSDADDEDLSSDVQGSEATGAPKIYITAANRQNGQRFEHGIVKSDLAGDAVLRGDVPGAKFRQLENFFAMLQQGLEQEAASTNTQSLSCTSAEDVVAAGATSTFRICIRVTMGDGLFATAFAAIVVLQCTAAASQEAIHRAAMRSQRAEFEERLETQSTVLQAQIDNLQEKFAELYERGVATDPRAFQGADGRIEIPIHNAVEVDGLLQALVFTRDFKQNGLPTTDCVCPGSCGCPGGYYTLEPGSYQVDSVVSTLQLRTVFIRGAVEFIGTEADAELGLSGGRGCITASITVQDGGSLLLKNVSKTSGITLTTGSVLSAENVLFCGAPAYGLAINIPDPVDYTTHDERQPSFTGAKVSLKDCTFERYATALRVTPGADVSAAGCTFRSCHSSALVVGSDLKDFRWPAVKPAAFQEIPEAKCSLDDCTFENCRVFDDTTLCRGSAVLVWTRGNVTLNRGEVRSCTGGEAAIYTVGDVTPTGQGAGNFPASVPAGQAVLSGVRFGGNSPADHAVGKNAVNSLAARNGIADGSKQPYATSVQDVNSNGTKDNRNCGGKYKTA